DALTAAGEVTWMGLEPIGDRDGRVAVYLADRLSSLLPPPARLPQLAARDEAILRFLSAHGASFFGPLHEAIGGGYPAGTVAALWRLVWHGLVTNDTFHALRAFTRTHASSRKKRRDVDRPVFRSRRLVPPTAEGRWTLVRSDTASPSSGSTRQPRKDATQW